MSRWAVAFGVLICLVLLPAVSAFAVPSTVTTLPVSPSYKEDLKVFGDWVVWLDYHGPYDSSTYSEYLGYNLSTGEERSFGGEPFLWHGRDWLWWNGTGFTIEDTSTETTFAIPVDNATEHNGGIELFGDRAAWSDWTWESGQLGSRLALFDLRSKVETQMPYSAGDQYEPDMDGDWLTWADTSEGYVNGRVRGLNLSTGATFTIDPGHWPSGWRQDYPRIGQGYVVFQSQPAGNPDRGSEFAYEIATGKVFILDSYDAWAGSGDIGGGVMAWLADDPTGRRAIRGFDILSGSAFTIAPPMGLTSCYFAGMSDGRVAWLGGNMDSTDIYLTRTTQVEGVIGSDAFDTAVKASELGYPDPSSDATDAVPDTTSSAQARSASIAACSSSPVRRAESLDVAANPARIADTVVVASGQSWSEGLGAPALAGAYDAPLLLTPRDTLPSEVAAEIARLNPAHVIVVGGSGSVSASVVSQLRSAFPAGYVTRIAGKTPYQTARLTAVATIAEQGAAYDGTAFVASGKGYSDALAAGAIQVKKKWPVYLSPSKGLSTADAKQMMADGVRRVIILGSTKAVGSSTQSRLRRVFGTSAVTRIAGDAHHSTSQAIAQWSVSKGIFGWSNLAITTSKGFQDALSASVLQSKRGAPILFTPPGSLDNSTASTLKSNVKTISRFAYVGGAVNKPVRAKIRAILR